jgi:transposase InsO family protein
VGRKGQCWDNAVAESFFATIKTELLDRCGWPTRTAAHKAIFEYIEGWYKHPTPALQPRLPQPQHLRNQTPDNPADERPPGSLTPTSTTLSVKSGQPQRSSPCRAGVHSWALSESR